MNNSDINNVMFHLQPTCGCSQEEIDSWNSNITVTDRSQGDNFYQCKDMVNNVNCTQANTTDEYDTLLCKIKISHRILENSIDG